ncbi:hypothetical protein ACFLSX_01585 [Calditrichota bacterium]
MEEKSKIEFIDVFSKNETFQTNRQTMTRTEFFDLVGKTYLPGTTALINIKSLPKASAVLILSGSEVPELISRHANSGMSHTQLTPIMVLQLNPNGEAAESDNLSNNNTSSKATDNSDSNNEFEMTEPQRRFIFRLLAEKKGLKNAQAENFLKDHFQISSIRDITKTAASGLIEDLLEGGDE